MRPLFILGPTHSAALRTWIKARCSTMASQIHPCQVPSSQGNNPFIYFSHMECPPFHLIFAYWNTTLRLGSNEELKPFPTPAPFLLHAQMAPCDSWQPAHYSGYLGRPCLPCESASCAHVNALFPSLVRVMVVVAEDVLYFPTHERCIFCLGFKPQVMTTKPFSTPFSWPQQVGNTDPKGKKITEDAG